MEEENPPISAYVLITCDLGYEEMVIDELKHFDDVKEIHGVYGAYDIMAKVESQNHDSLRETITWHIRKLNRVRSTLTLSCIEGQEFQRQLT